MFYFKGQRRPLELAPTQAEAFVMRVTHRSLFQPLCLSPSPPHPPPCALHLGGGREGWLGGGGEGVDGGCCPYGGCGPLSVAHQTL